MELPTKLRESLIEWVQFTLLRGFVSQKMKALGYFLSRLPNCLLKRNKKLLSPEPLCYVAEPITIAAMLSLAAGILLVLLIIVCFTVYALRKERCCFSRKYSLILVFVILWNRFTPDHHEHLWISSKCWPIYTSDSEWFRMYTTVQAFYKKAIRRLFHNKATNPQRVKIFYP